METRPIDEITFLRLENTSLKINQMRTALQNMANKALTDAGLSQAEWAIDLDKGVYVKKSPPAGPPGTNGTGPA